MGIPPLIHLQLVRTLFPDRYLSIGLLPDGRGRVVRNYRRRFRAPHYGRRMFSGATLRKNDKGAPLLLPSPIHGSRNNCYRGRRTLTPPRPNNRPSQLRLSTSPQSPLAHHLNHHCLIPAASRGTTLNHPWHIPAAGGYLMKCIGSHESRL